MDKTIELFGFQIITYEIVEIRINSKF